MTRDKVKWKACDSRDRRIRLSDGRIILVRTEFDLCQHIPLLIAREIRDNHLVAMARLMEQK